MRMTRLRDFSETTRILKCARSTVAIRVHLLRGRLRAELFSEAKGHIILAPSKGRFVKRTDQVLCSMGGTGGSVGSSTRLGGPLRVKAVRSLYATGLPTILDGFHRFRPGMGVRIAVSAPRRLVQVVRRGKLSLVCVLSAPE